MEPPSRHATVIAVLVLAGLIVSILVEVLLIGSPTEDLPGVALGSDVILLVEQVAALFAAWLLVLVVIGRALSGELPVEISGRGVRYADAAIAQSGLTDAEAAFGRVDDQIRALQEAVAALEVREDRQTELLDDML